MWAADHCREIRHRLTCLQFNNVFVRSASRFAPSNFDRLTKHIELTIRWQRFHGNQQPPRERNGSGFSISFNPSTWPKKRRASISHPSARADQFISMKLINVISDFLAAPQFVLVPKLAKHWKADRNQGQSFRSIRGGVSRPRVTAQPDSMRIGSENRRSICKGTPTLFRSRHIHVPRA